jgi:S-phase kinase-associated protein 1
MLEENNSMSSTLDDGIPVVPATSVVEDVSMSLDNTEEEQMLKLISSDGKAFELPKNVALQSVLVKTMSEGDKEAQDIPLPNVNSIVLDKVVQYLMHHVNNPAREIEKPLKSSDMKQVVSTWDAEFVDVDQTLLFEIIVASNYMDIKPLLDLCCAKVASMMKGKTASAIRRTFGLPEPEPTVRTPVPEMLEEERKEGEDTEQKEGEDTEQKYDTME